MATLRDTPELCSGEAHPGNGLEAIAISRSVNIFPESSDSRWKKFIGRYEGTKKRAGIYKFAPAYDDFRLSHNE